MADKRLALLGMRVRRSEPAPDGIQLIELMSPDGGALPGFTPRSHLAVKVPGDAMRNYSLYNGLHERDRYVIAVVLLQTAGRGSRSGWR